MDLYAGGGCKVVRVFPRLEHNCVRTSGKSIRQALPNACIALAGTQPARDVVLVPLGQKMVDQHIAHIRVALFQDGAQKLRNMTVSCILAQKQLKAVPAFGTDQRQRQGRVYKLHIEQVDVGDLKGRLVQIDGIAHLIGRGQRVTGGLLRDSLLDGLPFLVRNGDLNLMGGVPIPDGDGVPFAGDGLAGQVRGLFLLGLGEDGICLIHDFPMQAIAKVRHIVVQPHKFRVCDGECRPFDRCVTLKDSGFPVRIAAGVLVGFVRQHQLLHHGLIAVVYLPDRGRRGHSRIRFLLRDPFHIGHDLLHKSGGLIPGLFQMVTDGGRVNVLKTVLFFLGEKSALLHQTGKVALHLGPGQIGGRAHPIDRVCRKIIAVFIFQPFRCAPITGMVGHVLLHPALTVHITVPLLEGGVNISLGDLPRRCRGRDGRCAPRYMDGRFSFRR